jgi:hypothetical protein
MQRGFARAPFARAAGARGAVMIEALMVISVITLAFAGGTFFHGMFASKLKSNRDARLDAWTQALVGCGEKLESGSLFDTSGEPPIDDVDTTSPPGFLRVGHVSKSVSSAPVTAPALLGRKTVTFTASHQVACNDRLQGEKEDVFGRIGDAIGTIIGSVFK